MLDACAAAQKRLQPTTREELDLDLAQGLHQVLVGFRGWGARFGASGFHEEFKGLWGIRLYGSLGLRLRTLGFCASGLA